MDDEQQLSLLCAACAELDTMIDEGNPPDIVLDLTLGGMTSEVMKSISKTLGLPTVTSTMGEEEDIPPRMFQGKPPKCHSCGVVGHTEK